MSFARARFALVTAASFTAAASGCATGNGVGPDTGGTPTTTSTTSTTTTSASTTTTTGMIDPTVTECETCLNNTCSTEKAACTADCYNIQACLDAVCANLSITGAATEGDCQTYCEGLYPDGMQPLIDYVNCIQGAESCMPPCAGPPYDYEQCASAQIGGPCQAQSAACNASSDCTTYQSCAAGCATADACEACGTGTTESSGEKLYQALQLCIDQTCLATYWVPQM